MTRATVRRTPLTAGPMPAATSVVRALLVQDGHADAGAAASFETCLGHLSDVAVERVDRIAAACQRLVADRFDVVLLDLSLSDMPGLEGIEVLKAAAPDVPIIVIAGLDAERLARAAVKIGVQDYITVGRDDERIVRHAIRHAIDRHLHRREREVLLARERDARAAAEEARAIAEEARATAERAVRVRDEVLGMVSHDLRSPLTAIEMSANALLDGSGELPVLASAIVRSSEWALRIIRDLLDVTAIEAGGLAIHPEPMTVQAILEMISSMFASPAAVAGVTLTVRRVGPPLWVDADVDRVVQAVGNLVGNAIKFTPRGGSVALTVRRAEQTVLFRVEDTGPGIAPEHVPRLFDRFWQAHESGRSGAGLGLVIAQGIATGHGGRIDVESRVGLGSAFTFVLPVHP